MPSAFARTKIQAPRFRTDLVERFDLERRLAKALIENAVVLLVAPAGYGKTAALSRQLRRMPENHASAWVTCDEDDDLPRFVACLTEALEPYDPPWRIAPEGLIALVNQEHGLRAAVDEMVNALHGIPIRHGVIAVDDMHLMPDRRTFDFLALMIERAPSNWTFAIAARVTVPLTLGRLRAQREVAEFTQTDLSFSRQEIQLLRQSFGVHDSAATTERLLEHTRGWAAGLCLSLSVPDDPSGRDSRHDQRHLFDYLAVEVLGHMPAELRGFLLRCSVLSELTVERCAAVSGNPRTAALLEDIERRGLFVSVLDSEVFTLRLHDLFRDFLFHQLERHHADEVPPLLLRVARGEHDLARRVRMLLRAGACAEAEEALLALAPMLLMEDAITQVDRLVELFPPGRRERSASLAFVRGCAALQAWAVLTAQSNMARAAEGFELENRLSLAQRARIFEGMSLTLLGKLAQAEECLRRASLHPLDVEAQALMAWVNCTRAFVGGDATAAAAHLTRVVELLEAGAPPRLWARCAPTFACVACTELKAPIARFIKGALRVAGDTDLALAVNAHNLQAWLLLLDGQLPEARAVMDECQQDDQWLGCPRWLQVPATWFEMSYSTLLGDAGAVTRAATALLDDVYRDPERQRLWLPARYLHAVGTHAMALDDWATVKRIDSNLDMTPTMDEWPYLGPGRLAIKGAMALNDGRTDEALRLLRAAVEKADRLRNLGQNGIDRITLARAELRHGSAKAAWIALEPLVRTVRASGQTGTLLLAGPTALRELADADWAGIASPQDIVFMRRLWPLALELRGTSPKSLPAAAAQTKLSAREHQVLRGLAAGRANKQIAHDLNLSPHTIKRHVARILERLDFSSRGQAAAWYRNQVMG